MTDQANYENSPQNERPHSESSDEQRPTPEELEATFKALGGRERAPADVEAIVQDVVGFGGKVYLDPGVPDATVYVTHDNLLSRGGSWLDEPRLDAEHLAKVTDEAADLSVRRPDPQANMELLESGPADAGDLETLRREHDVIYLDGEKIGMVWKAGWAQRLVDAVRQAELDPPEDDESLDIEVQIPLMVADLKAEDLTSGDEYDCMMTDAEYLCLARSLIEQGWRK